MKNIERPEVQEVLVSLFMGDIFPVTAYKKIYALAGKTMMSNKELYDWFNSDYVELHKWEPWELEAMKHIDKKYTSIEYVEGYVCVTEFGRDEKNLSLINFPSIKEGDLIYIDEELERNGMHR